ncbi:MAG: hypothetical protein KGJ40_05000 [candidate division NC10 bacterium]|nr:hypothetical protein [candidate division NC10 bacterium]MDE2483922.1 hypothetical protein [candidate division NC10 bacterium]
MAVVIRITIDTMCINARGHIPALNALEVLAKQRVIEITSTRILAEELARDKTQFGPNRRAKASQLQSGTSGFVMRRSTLRGGDALGAPNAYVYLDRIARIIQPDLEWHELDEHTQRDIMHLAIHRAHNWDLFVTKEKEILRKSRVLLSDLGLRVMSPKGALKTVNEMKSG